MKSRLIRASLSAVLVSTFSSFAVQPLPPAGCPGGPPGVPGPQCGPGDEKP